uniref:TATA box-binding protein-associated factor RNA polymerase I subunit B n=1 Tax=Nomascus leucogenys TaxID=61853 RepID=A0A2I3GL41_NOMLE
MDLEEAEEFKERCTQCAAVSWGLTDEGKYYCTSCHNVTERYQEVTNTDLIPNTQIKYILYQQAEALKNLGVGPELKNDVLHNFWKRYLQKSKQAYCKNPVYTTGRKPTVFEDNLSHSDWASEPELLSDVSCPPFLESGAESQSDIHTRKPFPISKASQSETSLKNSLFLGPQSPNRSQASTEHADMLKIFQCLSALKNSHNNSPLLDHYAGATLKF